MTRKKHDLKKITLTHKKKQIRPGARIWLRRILLILIGLVFGMWLFRWNAATLAGNKLPMPFGYATALVMSGSMAPTLEGHELVIVREAEEYAIGDIVIYQSGDSLVIHKIIDIRGDMVTTKGDANNIPDEPIRDVYIKGKMVAAIPGLGTVIKLLKSTLGTIVIIAMAVLLLELSWRKEKAADTKQVDALKEEIRALKEELDQEI